MLFTRSNKKTSGLHDILQAFSWGFDIRDWGKHVNAVTWPEILRQFSLAAGFGPKWKKRKPVPDRAKDAPEVKYLK